MAIEKLKYPSRLMLVLDGLDFVLEMSFGEFFDEGLKIH